MKKFTFSRTEIREILLSAIVLSAAFAISFSGGVSGLGPGILPMVAFSFIAVGIGFLAHEIIGHKFTAQYYNLFAEFRMWKTGLLFAIVSSLFGFVFAAPGAVMISQNIDLWGSPVPVTKKRMGIVAIMGPVVNLALAAVSLALHFINPVIIQMSFGRIELFSYAMQINIWLALFNMLPIPPLDGSKILAWDKRIWLAFFAVLVAVFFFL